jgi:hypothetical protein
MHVLICGRTESGKSTLAKELGSELRLAGEEVFAYNPTLELGYTHRDDHGRAGAGWEHHDPDVFAAEIARRIATPQRRWIIVDEAHEFFTRGDCQHAWIGTRGRHYGLNVIAITQAGQQLHPTVRGQCGTLYLFPCSLNDAAFLANQFGKRQLEDVVNLPNGSYFKVSRGLLTSGRLWE